MAKQRVMVVGEFQWPWYQEACSKALERLGCDVERFGWAETFYSWQNGRSEPSFRSSWHRLQVGLQTGPAVWKIQKTLIERAIGFEPHIIWFYNVQLISPSVVEAMRSALPNTLFVQYSNDNPFSKSACRRLWRNFLACIPLFDVHFCYRHRNIDDFIRWGAKRVHLLRSYFIPTEDYPLPESEIPDIFKCDIVFAGHYEDDGRVALLESLCEQGFRLNLYGGGWNKLSSQLKTNSPLREKLPTYPVTGNDYRKAICGAKIALCILSTLNMDTYTRRSFQITAMRTAMLSQYSDDLANMFEEDKSIAFFRNKTELLAKTTALLENDQWRASVANEGYSAVQLGGHDVYSRMAEWLDTNNRYTRLT